MRFLNLARILLRESLIFAIFFNSQKLRRTKISTNEVYLSANDVPYKICSNVQCGMFVNCLVKQRQKH